MKAPIKIGLPPNLKSLYIERYPTIPEINHTVYGIDAYDEKIVEVISAPEVSGYWKLPIHVGKDPQLGTFLLLHDDGKIERLTVREDEGDEVVLIKPKDG